MFTGWALLNFDLSCVTLGQECAAIPPTCQNQPDSTQPIGLGCEFFFTMGRIGFGS